MPELPEVQTISNDLKNTLTGYTIKDVVIANKYTVYPSKDVFLEKVKGKAIKNVHRKAKNILITLENDTYIAIHLAMTGRVLIRNPENREDKWIKVLFIVNKEQDIKHLRFSDVRMFGKVKFIEQSELVELYEKYGPEPIQEDLTAEEFLKQVKSKRTNIKNALLDQSIISGLGNIYATDALFIAGIHPMTPTSKLTSEDGKKLFEASKNILLEGIEHRGSTLEDKMYVDVFGKEGSHQKYFRIYNKKTCPNCNHKVEVIKINGRGTYFCPSCQHLK